MTIRGARLALLAFSIFAGGCIRVPRPVAAEFCAQSPKESHFAPGDSSEKPKCCMPRPPTVAKSGSAVEGARCAR